MIYYCYYLLLLLFIIIIITIIIIVIIIIVIIIVIIVIIIIVIISGLTISNEVHAMKGLQELLLGWPNGLADQQMQQMCHLVHSWFIAG